MDNPLIFVDPDGKIPVVIVPIVYGVALLAASPAGQRGIQLVSQVGARYGPQVARIATTHGQAISTQLFRFGNAVRGGAIETLRGANLPNVFPVIDRFSQGIAASIKSTDLFAKSYQNMGALTSRLTGYVDKLANFKSSDIGRTTVKAGEITQRVLEVIIPKGTLSPQQQQTLKTVAEYARKKGVEVRYLQAQ